jgi:hypothetical protein
MKRVLSFFILSFLCLSHITRSQTVSLTYDKSLPQAVYAVEILEKHLLNQGYSLKKEQADYTITLKTNNNHPGAEAYTIQLQGKQIVITGGAGFFNKSKRGYRKTF